jgi:hypothetical protein
MENEHFEIKSVKNLVPVWVEYESNGSTFNDVVYVDYEKQKVINRRPNEFIGAEFENAILTALREKNAKLRRPSTSIPPEVYKQFQERKNRLEK